MHYMKKNTVFKIILFISIISLLFTMLPSTTARPVDWYFSYSIIELEYDNEAAKDPLLPINRTKEIPISINYYVDGYFDSVIPTFYEHLDNYIRLKVANKPDWCEASLSPNLLLTKATAEGIEENVTLILKISEDAHASQTDKIGIEITVDNMGPIKGATYFSNVTFIAGYLPLLKLDIQENTVRSLNPMEKTNFNIQVENLGNAKTILKTKIADIPTGWTATIPESTVVGSKTIGDNPLKEISLEVQPAIDFGYHNERQLIQVTITPTSFLDPSTEGEDYVLTFLIHSEGFSTPGYEIHIVFFAALIIFCFFILKRKSKQQKQFQKRGDKKL